MDIVGRYDYETFWPVNMINMFTFVTCTINSNKRDLACWMLPAAAAGRVAGSSMYGLPVRTGSFGKINLDISLLFTFLIEQSYRNIWFWYLHFYELCDLHYVRGRTAIFSQFYTQYLLVLVYRFQIHISVYFSDWVDTKLLFDKLINKLASILFIL